MNVQCPSCLSTLFPVEGRKCTFCQDKEAKQFIFNGGINHGEHISIRELITVQLMNVDQPGSHATRATE